MDSRTIFQNSSVTAFTMFRVDSCASRSMPFLVKRRRGWRGLEGEGEGGRGRGGGGGGEEEEEEEEEEGKEEEEEKEEQGVELTSEWPLLLTVDQFHFHSHSSTEEKHGIAQHSS